MKPITSRHCRQTDMPAVINSLRATPLLGSSVIRHMPHMHQRLHTGATRTIGRGHPLEPSLVRRQPGAVVLTASLLTPPPHLWFRARVRSLKVIGDLSNIWIVTCSRSMDKGRQIG